VRKLVPTLTSTSVEIYLSMVGAKQHVDTSFILVPAVGRTSSRGRSRCCIVLHRSACRGGLQAWRDKRRGLQVPEV
jgi:hypothetical protein